MSGSLGSRPVQGPQYLSPEVKVEKDRLVLKTYDHVTVAPADVPLTIVKGSRFQLKIDWVDGDGKPRDLAGWSFAMAIYVQPGDATPVQTLTPTIAGGLIVWDVLASATAAYTGWTRGVYKLVATNGTDIVRLMQSVAELLS